MKSEKVFEAIEFAVKAHRGQFRKGTKLPYILHPLGVAKILIEHECYEEIVIAGILHDTVEDTPVTLDDIKEHFGVRVAGLVEALSEPDKSDSWENRKQHTIDYLKTAPVDVLLIACADKLNNIRAIQEDYAKHGETLWSRFNRPKMKQKWYYQALADVFVSRIESEVSKSLFTDFQSEVDKVFGNGINESK
jgi:(p)ppGpp synthase/HD superfamily hydrolase